MNRKRKTNSFYRKEIFYFTQLRSLQHIDVRIIFSYMRAHKTSIIRFNYKRYSKSVKLEFKI